MKKITYSFVLIFFGFAFFSMDYQPCAYDYNQAIMDATTQRSERYKECLWRRNYLFCIAGADGQYHAALETAMDEMLKCVEEYY